ncbi:hypothetical protein GCM10011374_40570 [Kocuria dechangensis]|uniref:Uncharacterized protein n=1 Tax=Kocuria dechangensis TaxID=1176249 RepID=A0A917M202_9MICC|nr:hypothetical protein [Kocuria dechangensis]GGG71730.1 hypothetical protein GCM10011374_40570 [Kocuria dechangensis]
MVKKRGPMPENRDDQIERFAAAAEANVPAPAEEGPPMTPWKRRARNGSKAKGYNFRFNTAQHALLNYAAEAEDTSQQKLIEDLVWPILEERYGHNVPLK